ncbi:MAG TPA: DUF2798 domain-containing protein [Flavisolibacter sp.]|jgi:hypothetical protein|nr:DUF2798 domain-containing protein [Flavisolibacter sp.]
MNPKILFAFIMGSITTCLVSFTLILVNKGFVSGFTLLWLKSWLISYLVAVPVILVIGPKVQAALNRTFLKR